MNDPNSFRVLNCKSEREAILEHIAEIFQREGASSQTMRWERLAQTIFTAMGNDPTTKKGKHQFKEFRLDSQEAKAFMESLSPEELVELFHRIVSQALRQM